MTPRFFFALLERHSNREKRLDFRSGIIAATVANSNRGKNSKAYLPEDFMPSLKATKEAAAQQQTWQEQLDMAKRLHAFFGGKKQKGKKVA